MTPRWMIPLAGLGLLLTVACPKNDEVTDRPTLTADECRSRGGTVVGDIGDGAVHRPDYRCANGEPPIGTIRAETGEPVAVEGAVCCPQ